MRTPAPKQPQRKVTKSVTRTVKTEIILEQREYDRILRNAVGAPDGATVSIENDYGGDITVSWTETSYEDSEE